MLVASGYWLLGGLNIMHNLINFGVNFRIICHISSTDSKHKEKIRLWSDDILADFQSSCGFCHTRECESLGISRWTSLEYTDGPHCMRLCELARLSFVGKWWTSRFHRLQIPWPCQYNSRYLYKAMPFTISS